MNLVIFGATGGTGRELVKQALAAGHAVTAYVRNPAKVDVQNERLHVVQGEIDDADAVTAALAGADAVLSGLGPMRGGPDDTMSTAARTITEAMKQQGVRRLIWSTGAGVRDPKDQPTFMHKFMGVLLKLISGKVLADSEVGVSIVKASDLDWVVVRGPMLTNEPGSGQFRLGYVDGDMGRTLSRANFAAAMLQQVEGDEWVGKMPAVCDA